MLLKWSLRDFKSFQDNTELPLSPITILSGANSSGKSSVIQSILLVKQTLQHSAAGRAVALNGPLVRLGTFSDIENAISKSSQKTHSISIGWQLRKSPEHVPPPLSAVSGTESIDDLEVNFEIDMHGAKADRETLELQPTLARVKTSGRYTDGDGEDHQYRICVSRASGKGRKFLYEQAAIEGIADPFGYTVRELDEETTARAKEPFPKARIVGCQFRYFMPTALLVRFDRARLTAQQTALAISAGKVSRRWLNLEIPSEAADLLRELLESIATGTAIPPGTHSLGDRGSGLPVADYARVVGQLSPLMRRRFLSMVDENKFRIERILIGHFGSQLVIVPSRVDVLREGFLRTDSFFKYSLHYVGPLRDEPRPLYALQALASTTDVGPKGELTAAVLHLNERRQIEFVSAESFADDEVRKLIKRATLRDALSEWLRYLGIAHDFQTSEKGKFGHELRIKTDPSMEFQDLTNVGIGVSQLLPVLVNCLLANAGSTIVLEQPELHLHPAIQARLADFFISMGLMGKQCIIETHGEHIIERFRFRVVANQSDEIRNLTKIYFFRRKGACTAIRTVDITKYGAIVDWPEDFFDQSQKESERIISKALERRRVDKGSILKAD